MIKGNATRGISNNRLTRLTPPFFFQFRRPVIDCPKNKDVLTPKILPKLIDESKS